MMAFESAGPSRVRPAPAPAVAGCRGAATDLEAAGLGQPRPGGTGMT